MTLNRHRGRKMKKFTLILLTLLVIVFIFSIFLIIPKEQPLNSVIKIKDRAIDKIELRNGNNGKTSIILDKDKITRITEYLEKIRVKKKYFVPPTSGWSYNITFYSLDRAVGSITFNDPLYIDGRRYSITDKVFSYSKVYGFIEVLFSEEHINFK